MGEVKYALEYEITGSTVDGDTATVDFWITGEILFGEQGVPVDEGHTVDLVREDGVWLVCDDFTGI